MIDIHTHILPYIDDGASDELMSMTMLSILEKQEVSDVVLTPHFYSHMESLEDFIKKRKKCFDNFKNLYTGFINIYLGAEVYLTKYLNKYEDLKPLCINNSKYMLIELPLDSTIDDKVLNIFDGIIYNHKITPILAHIERYPFLYDGKLQRDLDFLRSMGCLIQVNIDQLTISRRVRKVVLSLIKNGKVNFLGSDSHNLTTRPPVYKEGVKVIESKLGIEYLAPIWKYEKKLLDEIRPLKNI